MTVAVEEHYEELDFLWGLRRAALRSPSYTPTEFTYLESRIEAHLQALLAEGEAAVPFLRERLQSRHAGASFAAAYPLLRSDNEALSAEVLAAFLGADGAARDGLCEALCQAAPPPLFPALRVATEAANPVAQAACVLAFRSPESLDAATLGRLVRRSGRDALVAWRAAALGGVAPPQALYDEGLADSASVIRRAALEAAAWARESWLAEHCRRAASGPDRSAALELLAVLGHEQDLGLLLEAAGDKNLGPERFALLGTLGHPACLGILVEAIKRGDVRSAVAAGTAFTRISGRSVDSATRVTLTPEGGREPDAFESEFLDEVVLPDAELARRYWDGLRPELASGRRWCRGSRLDGVSDVVMRVPDRQALWEVRMRGKLTGSWQGRLAELEMYPGRGDG